MKLIEKIQEGLAKIVLTPQMRERLKEELNPYDHWKVNWQTVIKADDDQSWIRKERVKKSFECWERNPIAQSGIEYLVAYILGKGLTYTTEHEDIKRALDSFWQKNQMDTLHYELIRTRFVDGENFIWFLLPEGQQKLQLGQIPVILPIDSSEISYIARKPDNALEPWYYHREYKIQKYPDISQNAIQTLPPTEIVNENIPAEQMIHFKRSGLTNLSRGRGLLNTALEYFDEYKHWLKIRIVLNRVKSIFAWLVKLATRNQTEIDNWQRKFDNFAKYDKDGNLLDTIPIGQPIIYGEGMEIKAESPQINASGSLEDGRQIKLMLAVALGLPEFALSDGQNANLATTQSQQSPLVKRMELEQEQVRLFFRKIFDKVLQLMIDSGDLNETYEIEQRKPDGTTEIIEKTPQECYDLIFPEIAVDDIAGLATPLKTLVDAEILSRETAVTLLGYDPAQEQERIKKEKKLGFKSASSQAGLFGSIEEAIPKEDLKKINSLKEDCQKELKENYERYKLNLVKGVTNAKEIFIANHQEIVRKYVEQGATEGYAHSILKAFK